jgi:hypothetical protein
LVAGAVGLEDSAKAAPVEVRVAGSEEMAVVTLVPSREGPGQGLR